MEVQQHANANIYIFTDRNRLRWSTETRRQRPPSVVTARWTTTASKTVDTAVARPLVCWAALQRVTQRVIVAHGLRVLLRSFDYIKCSHLMNFLQDKKAFVPWTNASSNAALLHCRFQALTSVYVRVHKHLWPTSFLMHGTSFNRMMFQVAKVTKLA